MSKTLVAIALACALAPALAFADESTAPPNPQRAQTPGNGPTIVHGHHRYRHMSRGEDAKAERAAAEAGRAGYDAGATGAGDMSRPTWSGPSYSPYANLIPGPAPAGETTAQ